MNQQKFLKRFFYKTGMMIVGLLLSLQLYAQQKTVTGTILDESGEGLPGVNVVVRGTTVGTVTDTNGKYSINISDENAVLQVSFIGYAPQELIVGNQTVMNFTLKEETTELDEVVVIGYQTVRRRDLTGSVASVSNKDLVASPVANVAQALQGKLPGVNIISQDGRPNATISIRVRGGGSISQSNDPLILIDGVPGTLSDIPSDMVESIDVLKDASSTAIYGARGANGVILVTTKNAKESKVAVTYSGYAKFNTPTKYTEALGPYDYLRYIWANAYANGAGSYGAPLEKLYGLGANAAAYGNPGGIEAYRDVAHYDAQKDVYNSSFSQNHDLSISGGTDRTKVRLAINYMDEDGMKINSYYKRANISLKVTQKVFDNLEVGLDARFTNTETMSGESTSSGSGSVLSAAYRFRPIALDDIKGDLSALREGNIESFGKTSQWDAYNPAVRLQDYEPLSTRQRLLGTFSINWNIIKDLSYRTELTLGRRWDQTKTWSGAGYKVVDGYLDADGNKLWAGDVDYRRGDDWNMRWTNTINYNKTFGKIHSLNVVVGQEVTNSAGSEIRIGATKFAANYTKENAFAMVNQGTLAGSSSADTPDRMLSLFGRANYTLLDRYLLTVTMRADGSSKFSPQHRWGYFPAAALAWRASEESFLKDVSWMDYLKLRLSFGTVGNDGISSSLWSQLWTADTDQRRAQIINGVVQPGYNLASTTAMANPNLQWETTITRDLGIDFSVFKNRVSGTVDLYWNTTKDLLMQTTVPGITGFTTTYANIGQTSNKGVEISLTGNIYRNSDWSVTAGFNINFNKNNIDKLAPNITGKYGTAWASSGLYPTYDYTLEEGRPVGLVRGLVYDGFYTPDDFVYENGMYTLKPGVPDLASQLVSVLHGVTNGTDKPSSQVAYPGVPKFKNLSDTDPNNPRIHDEDLTVIGDMNPKHTGGFNINVAYKGFDLGIYFNWSYGNQIYNVNKLASLYGPKENGVFENKLAIMNNSYKIYDVVNGQLVRLTTPDDLNAANKNASLPLSYGENGLTSSLGIEDGSFLRLNTLTLGYTIPSDLTKKIKINNLRVYGTIYNLCTITGYSGLDPEVNTNLSQNNAIYPTMGMDWGAYPRARQFVIGLNLNF